MNTYLDLPKGAEWMIGGAYTPSFRIKQDPLEDAGIHIHNHNWLVVEPTHLKRYDRQNGNLLPPSFGVNIKIYKIYG